MQTFCTISTSSHLFKSFALAESLSVFGHQLDILLLDGKAQEKNTPENIRFFSISEIDDSRVKKIKLKYKSDKLRWSLKPVLLNHLLDRYEKVIYVDNDQFFFSDPSELFSLLNEDNILLSPHNYPSSPIENQNWLEANLRLGLYNAGFLGANRQAKKALEWWADCCIYELKKSFRRGLFDDQKYLDLMPVKFDGVKILKHKGYNFAGWNEHLQPKKDEIVFVHFNAFTLEKFNQDSSTYKYLLDDYLNSLRKFNAEYKLEKRKKNFTEFKNYLNYLLWKVEKSSAR